MKNKKAHAFTLIELLVVISIIALLVSILMPALNKARQQGKSVVCQSNLKSLAVGFKLNTQQNEGRHLEVLDSDGQIWLTQIGKYIGEVDEVRYCPETPDIKFEIPSGTPTANQQENGSRIKPWGIWHEDGPDSQWELGSYGINNWMYSNPGDLWGDPATERYLNESAVKHSQEVPLFLDCMRFGAAAENNEAGFAPGLIDWEEGRGGAREYQICRYLINRHSQHGNIAFYDGHVEKVYLPDYFLLKWSKNSKINYNMAEQVKQDNPPK